MNEATNRQPNDLSRHTPDAFGHMTQQENESILKRYFKDGLDGRLSEFPRKEKRKIIILRHLLQRFEHGRRYTEQEVNERLAAAFDDYVTLRRYLIIYGFMDRQEDGRAYWVKEKK